MNWYLLVLKKYAVFNGRAQRKEYWMFYLFNFLFLLGLGVIDSLIGTSMQGQRVNVLSGIYSLAVFVPWLAVAVRRFHDIGKSGWKVLFFFVIIIFCSVVASLLVDHGSVLILLLFVLLLLFAALTFISLLARDSQPGDNQYGPNPKSMQK